MGEGGEVTTGRPMARRSGVPSQCSPPCEWAPPTCAPIPCPRRWPLAVRGVRVMAHGAASSLFPPFSSLVTQKSLHWPLVQNKGIAGTNSHFGKKQPNEGRHFKDADLQQSYGCNVHASVGQRVRSHAAPQSFDPPHPPLWRAPPPL